MTHITCSKEVLKFIENGNHLISKENYGKAAKGFEHAVVLDPECAPCWERLGTCYFFYKQYKKAHFCYERSWALDARDSLTAYNWGNLKHDTGDFGSAASLYREAIRLKPDYAEAHYNLAMALVNLRSAEWVDAMKHALKLNPRFELPAELAPYIKEN